MQPNPSGIQTSDSLEDVRKALNQERDPVKKAILARKARQLRGHGDLFNSHAPTLHAPRTLPS